MENGSVPKSPNVVLPPPSVLPSSVVSFQSTIGDGWDRTLEQEGEFETLIDGDEVHLPLPVKSSSMSEAVLRPPRSHDSWAHPAYRPLENAGGARFDAV